MRLFGALCAPALLACLTGCFEADPAPLVAGQPGTCEAIAVAAEVGARCNAGAAAACASDARPGSFLLETDAPFLAPVPYRGQRCEPAHVAATAAFVAAARGLPVEELVAQTVQATRAFFPRRS